MSSRKKDRMNIQRGRYQAYLKGLSIILAPELPIPELFQGVN